MPRLLLAGFIVLSARTALAQEFGRKGQIVPLGGVSFSAASEKGTSEKHLRVQPAAFYFLTDQFALGLEAGMGYDTPALDNGFPVANVLSWNVEPAIAAAFRIGDRFALFPQAGVSFAWSSYSDGGSAHSIQSEAFAPFLFIPVPHFFLGIGPVLQWTLDGVNSGRVVWGFSTVIGGWF
jgi:hypothetical protein